MGNIYKTATKIQLFISNKILNLNSLKILKASQITNDKYQNWNRVKYKDLQCKKCGKRSQEYLTNQ